MSAIDFALIKLVTPLLTKLRQCDPPFAEYVTNGDFIALTSEVRARKLGNKVGFAASVASFMKVAPRNALVTIVDELTVQGTPALPMRKCSHCGDRRATPRESGVVVYEGADGRRVAIGELYARLFNGCDKVTWDGAEVYGFANDVIVAIVMPCRYVGTEFLP